MDWKRMEDERLWIFRGVLFDEEIKEVSIIFAVKQRSANNFMHIPDKIISYCNISYCFTLYTYHNLIWPTSIPFRHIACL